MGNGASVGVSAAISKCSEDDLRAALAMLSGEGKARLQAALAPPKRGYVLGFFDLKNPVEFKTVYSPMAEPTLKPYGGKFIMKHALVPEMAKKMGMKESKGFGPTGQMAFMLEFETFEKAMGWFTGPEYAAVLAKRDEVSDFRMAVVEGAPIAPGSGLVLGFFDMKKPEEFKTVYSPMAEPTLNPYGGKFVVKHALVPEMAKKMGMKESKGFGTTGHMAFVLHFPDFEKAMGWFTGPEYAAVLGKRDEVADFKMAVVQTSGVLEVATLYTASFAPNPQLVDLCIREKGMAIAKREVDMLKAENRSPEMLAKNPAGQLPFVELANGKVISDTIAIVEYLDEVKPEPAMIGKTAVERAKTRMWQRRMEEHFVYPTFTAFRFWTASDAAEGSPFKDFFKGKAPVLLPEAWKGMQEWALSRLLWLEEQKKAAPSDFICGASVTVVDFQAYTTIKFFAVPGFGDFCKDHADKLPWTLSFMERMKGLESVKASEADVAKLSG